MIKFQDWKGGALIQQFASAHCIPPAEPTKVGYFVAIKNGSKINVGVDDFK